MKRPRFAPGTPARQPFLAFLLGAIPVAFLAIGCGMPGAPQPPSLNLPAPVEDLTAARTDGAVRLAWTMPKRSMDRIALKRPIPLQVCRRLETGPCAVIASTVADPGKPAGYTDNLPPDLTSGSLRLLAYQVRLLNRAQKSAGSSNAAATVAGASPLVVTGLAAQVLENGVLLSWHPATSATGKDVSTLFRIQRVLLTPGNTPQGGSSAPPVNTAKVPVNVTLAVPATNGVDPGHALDTNAQLNQRYRYTMERVETVSLAGHSIELAGQASGPIVVVTTDIFPPAVPKNVVAVADEAAGAIDLSWTPDTEPDLAGYYVYRRDTGTPLPAQRIGAQRTPMVTPGFRDTNVARGHTYAYSVSAIDQSGNESARSREAVETMPNQ